MLVQLAHAHGCPVIATCRKPAEAAFVMQLGADHVIDLGNSDYVARVREITNGIGVTKVFNGVGGDTLNTDFDVLAPFGELQAYGYVAGKTYLICSVWANRSRSRHFRRTTSCRPLCSKPPQRPCTNGFARDR